MAALLSGHLTAFFLFDIAEAADLAAVRAQVGAAGQDARFAPRSAIPAYVRYQQPPVQIDGEALGLPAPDGWSTRLKVYDYGVVSLALSRPFDGTWADLLALSQAVMNGAPLDATAEAYCRAAATRLRPALQEPRDTFLSEDYFVFGVTYAEGAPPAGGEGGGRLMSKIENKENKATKKKKWISEYIAYQDEAMPERQWGTSE